MTTLHVRHYGILILIIVTLISSLLTLAAPRLWEMTTVPQIIVHGAAILACIYLFYLLAALNRTIRNLLDSQELSTKKAASMDYALQAFETGFWHWDAQSSDIIWNRTMHELMGTDPDTFVVTLESVMGFTHPDDQKVIAREIEKCRAGKFHYGLSQRITTVSGKKRVLETKGLSVRNDSGEFIGLTGLCRDVTEKLSYNENLEQMLQAVKKEREKAEQAALSQKIFLAKMSHEIRTPMNAVLGFNHLALQSGLTDKQYNYVHKAYNSAQALLRIIDDILDLAAIETGSFSVKRVEFNLPETLDKIADVLALQAREHDIHLKFFTGNGLRKPLYNDSLRIAQVLVNLIGNAIKFSPSGSTVTISAEVIAEKAREMLQFTVVDNGIGISEEDQQNIFQPYSQVDNSESRVYQGSGLGLAISRAIADLLEGDLRLESTLGVGSTFYFTLPLHPLPLRGDFTAASTDDLSEELQQLDAKILLVEDNLVNQEVVMTLLTDMGAEVCVANSGQEALTTIQQEQFDIILMDIQMPGMDGYKTTAMIRESSHYNGCPIVAMTAHNSPEDIDRSIDNGLDGHIGKPIDPVSLHELILRWLQTRN